MIKNIVFDIGNVLVRFQPDEAMREIGIEENKIAALAHATYENPVWVELDRGVIPENEIIDEMVKVAPQYEADIRRFFKEGKAFVVKAFDYAADWIKELKSRGYRVYLLSNYPKDISNISCHWLGRSDSFSFFMIVSLWEVRWLWKNRKIFLKGVDIYDILKIRRIVI